MKLSCLVNPRKSKQAPASSSRHSRPVPARQFLTQLCLQKPAHKVRLCLCENRVGLQREHQSMGRSYPSMVLAEHYTGAPDRDAHWVHALRNPDHRALSGTALGSLRGPLSSELHHLLFPLVGIISGSDGCSLRTSHPRGRQGSRMIKPVCSGAHVGQFQ